MLYKLKYWQKFLIFLCFLILIVIYLTFHLKPLSELGILYKDPLLPVLVGVYYEALCSDSKHFIIKHLLPAYNELKHLMKVVLVPYGKAETYINDNGSYRFVCQHGEEECQANMYHACTIDIIKNEHLRLDIIACMIDDNYNPKEALLKCLDKYQIDEKFAIQNCYTGGHGHELLKLHGEATKSLRPSVTFIPTVTLDGSQGRQAAILKNLMNEICIMFQNHKEIANFCPKH